MLYLGLVKPHFGYYCFIWGSCGVTTCKTLDKLQTRAIRIITNSAYGVYVGPMLRQLKLPSISDMMKQESTGMVYKTLNDETPLYYTEQFTRIFTITSRTLCGYNFEIKASKIKI